MAKVIGVLNQKGGVGKTTISLHLADYLARKNNKVLLIDADPQASLLEWSDIRESSFSATIIGCAKKTLHREIEKLSDSYDYIVIDGAPRVTELARSCIMASDFILIPCTPSAYDIWAAKDLVELIEEAKIYKENIQYAFLINRKVANTLVGNEVVNAIQSMSESNIVFNNSINQRVVISESAGAGLSIYEMGTDIKAINEFNHVGDELLQFLEVKV